MAIDLADQDAALRAALRIFSKCYSAAESVDGAYQLTYEKNKDPIQRNKRPPK